MSLHKAYMLEDTTTLYILIAFDVVSRLVIFRIAFGYYAAEEPRE